MQSKSVPGEWHIQVLTNKNCRMFQEVVNKVPSTIVFLNVTFIRLEDHPRKTDIGEDQV